MRKRVLEHVHAAQSDQGLCFPLTESLDTIECINGQQMPGWDFAHAWDASESVSFAHEDTVSLGGPYNKEKMEKENQVIFTHYKINKNNRTNWNQVKILKKFEKWP